MALPAGLAAWGGQLGVRIAMADEGRSTGWQPLTAAGEGGVLAPDSQGGMDEGRPLRQDKGRPEGRRRRAAPNGLEMSRPASQGQYRAECNLRLAGSAPSSC